MNAGNSSEKVVDCLNVLRILCPPPLYQLFCQIPETVLQQLEEVRFRQHAPLQLCLAQEDCFLNERGKVVKDWREGLVVSEDWLQRMVQSATQSSLYAMEEDIKRGFLTLPGGHRLGIAGRAVLSETGSLRSIRNITSLALRIAKSHIGASRLLAPYISISKHRVPSLLLISPPQCGKTTLLRDLARACSQGEYQLPAQKVVVVDERSELAGIVEGMRTFDLGPRTDVLDGCPKAEGMMLAIRSLSPQVLVTDEIGRMEDGQAILEAAYAGVTVFATAHAASLEEWRMRPSMRPLFEQQAFSRYAVISRRRGPGTLEAVYDANGKTLIVPR